MYRAAIIGVSGGRAHGHAKAYAQIKGGELVAVSARQRDKLDAFADSYAVPHRYTDYRTMFAEQQPDLVHVNTPPNVRLEIMEAAAAAGIPALIVEKPLAIQWEDFLAIQAFAERASIKVAVNHQLHFHPRRQALQRLVRDGGIGELRFIDASSRMNLAYQGTHTLQAIGAFHPDGVAASVFAQAGGVEGLQPTAKAHYAPDRCLATLRYEDGLTALLRCGTNAPIATEDPRIPMHKRIAVYGSRGYVSWTMAGWEVVRDGQVESGSHDYFAEDVMGQAAMTEAMYAWLADDARVHPLNLDRALLDFEIVLSIYQSALSRQELALGSPADAPRQPELIQAMRQELGRQP